MSRARLPDSKFEVVAATGRRKGQRRKILIIAVYIPPWYAAERSRKCLRYVNDCLLLLTTRYDDPYIFIGGDYNRRDARMAAADFPHIKIVNTPPTRGNACLDLISTNVPDLIVDKGVTPYTTPRCLKATTRLYL